MFWKSFFWRANVSEDDNKSMKTNYPAYKELKTREKSRKQDINK